MKDKRIPIAEIFGPTIQGEGPHAGAKVLFVRVAGCDFNCSWCDSKWAWKITDETPRYEPLDLAREILQRCNKKFISRVVFTGGNPCLYDLEEVIWFLKQNGFQVDIETQGSIFPIWLRFVDTIVISPKGLSSKQPDVFDKVEAFLDDPSNYNGNDVIIKIPIFGLNDWLLANKYYKAFHNKAYVKIYLSVGNPYTDSTEDISKELLKKYEELIYKVVNSDMSDVYVLPQIHTLVWGNKRGV